MSGRGISEVDMLTFTSPGSPPGSSTYPVGSVVEVFFDVAQSIPAIKDDAPIPTCDALQSSSTATGHAHTPIPNVSSPKMNYRENPVPNNPIDIFGTGHGHSANMNDSELTLEPRINRFNRIALRVPKLRRDKVVPEVLNEKLENVAKDENELLKERLESLGILSRRSLRKPVAETGSSDGKADLPRMLSRRTRRIVSQTDHPLVCDMPLKIQDAEDLDLENKIRSALRRHRSVPRSDTSHKSVRFDPAIISLGSERLGIKSESAIPNSVPHYKPTIAKDEAAANQKEGSTLKDSLQTILSLKKHERDQLRELLDKLRKIEDALPVASTGARLNPLAPEFHGSSRIIHELGREKNCCNGWSTLPSFSNHYRPSLPPIWIHTPTALGTMANLISPAVPTIQRPQSIHTPIPIVNPYPTTDNGSGREAHVVDAGWAKSILETFAAKYPLTGKLKAAPPANSKGRHAATIQQRLEYLLMEQREKKALRPKNFDAVIEKDKENIGAPK